MSLQLIKHRIIVFALAALAVSLSLLIDTSGRGDMGMASLNGIHASIKRDFSSVSHISASQLSEIEPSDVVVFDVRERQEFDVSHLDGAFHVMPNIDPTEFINDYGHLLDGKRVVFYCSVGWRSSELASKLIDELITIGAVESFNLTGGIFNWANQSRKLSNSSKNETLKVHPYNDYWGKLVEDKTRLSYVFD